MKTQVAAAVAALVSAAALCGPALAQNAAGANAPKFGVAVVDINYIFENHQKFKSTMESMKTDLQSVDTEMKTKQQQILKVQEQKKSYTPGSPEFKQLDEQIVRMNAELQIEVKQKRTDFAEREAKIFYDTYTQVSQAINYYAERQNIGLVLRFNGSEADPSNRESILRGINQAVHFQNKIDITPDILALLNRTASRTGNARR